MIVSRGRGYVFVHIPKTGGTALALALEARAMRDDILIGDTPKARRRRARLKDVPTAGRLWKHSRLRDIEGLITRAEMRQLFVLTLVRNPWDRMVSYYHWLRAQRFDHPAVGLARCHDFSGFLHHPQTRASIAANPYPAHVALPDGSDGCDLYVRIEHVAADIAPFEARLGVALTPLPRVNASDRVRDWRGYYSDTDAALVAQLCGTDIARFGYRFDPG